MIPLRPPPSPPSRRITLSVDPTFLDQQDNFDPQAAEEYLETAQHEIQGADQIVESGAGPNGHTPKHANKERVTTPYMTKYERARILGTRALQISYAVSSSPPSPFSDSPKDAGANFQWLGNVIG
jgi:hypothetical protein